MVRIIMLDMHLIKATTLFVQFSSTHNQYSFFVTVFSVSLRQQLQDPGKKPFGAMHFNKDGSINNR